MHGERVKVDMYLVAYRIVSVFGSAYNVSLIQLYFVFTRIAPSL